MQLIQTPSSVVSSHFIVIHCKNPMVTSTNKYGYLSCMFNVCMALKRYEECAKCMHIANSLRNVMIE